MLSQQASVQLKSYGTISPTASDPHADAPHTRSMLQLSDTLVPLKRLVLVEAVG
jgi:hypothetical protein